MQRFLKLSNKRWIQSQKPVEIVWCTKVAEISLLQIYKPFLILPWWCNPGKKYYFFHYLCIFRIKNHKNKINSRRIFILQEIFTRFLHSCFQLIVLYRHSSIYAVNMGTHKKTAESKNHINRGYLVVLKGRKIG